MAYQPIKRAIAYSVVIGTLLSGHYAMATETESVTLSAPETENTTLVPVANEAMPEPAIVAMNIPQVTELEARTKLQSWIPTGYEPLYLAQLVKVYQANNLALIWQDEKIVQQLQQQIAEVAISGIQPQFGQWLTQLGTPELTKEARDLILSDAFLGYISFVEQVNKSGISLLYRNVMQTLPSPTDKSVVELQQNIQNNTLGSFVISYAPSHPYYNLMKEEVRKQLHSSVVWPEMQGTTSLKPNQSSQEVIPLRQILRNLKLIPELDANEQEIATTLYDAPLVAAVKLFQTAHGLEPDGIIGRQTRVWLNMTPAQRASIMALNIQRLRLTPAIGDTGIWVNIPDFSLYFYANNELILDSKVIVGRPDRKTPIMSSALNNVVVNPPWNVPTSMTRKDIVPRGKADPSYFSRKGYTIYSGWGNDAYPINPYDIDWQNMSANNFPYRIWQAPGPTNSLGRYKFNMPNSDAIYLHDTPNHSLFSKNMRAISSGCIRVNKASELASILLGDAGWKQDRIDAALKRGSTQYAPIPERIPVYLYYQTAWVAQENAPQYRADIYGYDKVITNAQPYLENIKKYF
ncbi:L,D-transpeptidase [Proteus terrae subsp. cibarius]|uniref:L,D-transpeptidase n=1 Tax=Proteus terrae subsp. cibarius TaxID=626774 RepID=A0ABX6JMN1_9GAMM|nr:L,D-transpeptidase [Proteus terrae]QGW02541.1 L,D-transpeptidase [Proteus terrae subsp. cibarius]QIF90447.1 L,D-transpeptidase [Proteus terrae subsp. cibarius]UAX02911.1 L,D-transpeptidase [Proteus terrae subsp. cibarius]